MQRETPKLGSHCVIPLPCEDGAAAWVIDRHVILGESDVSAGVTEKAYLYQGVGKGWHYVSLSGEVVTYLGNGKRCRGTGACKLAIGSPYCYFWCRAVCINVRRGGVYVYVVLACVGYAGLVTS